MSTWGMSVTLTVGEKVRTLGKDLLTHVMGLQIQIRFFPSQLKITALKFPLLLVSFFLTKYLLRESGVLKGTQKR
jgi:hypothetical protein